MKMEYVSLKVPINNEYWSAKKKQPLNFLESRNQSVNIMFDNILTLTLFHCNT